MAQTSVGAMKVLARKAGVSVEELVARRAAGEKWCYRCQRWQARACFVADRSRYDGMAASCHDCRSTRTAPGPTNRERRERRASGEAWCRGCAAWLPADRVAQGSCREHTAAAERARYASDATYRRSRQHRSAQRRRGVAAVPVEAQESLTDLFGGLCAYCDKPATTYDHIVPVSRGGQTEPRYVVPACGPCNSSKRDRDLDEWIAATGRDVKDELVNMLVMQHCWA